MTGGPGNGRDGARHPPSPRGEVLVTGAAGFIGAHLARACHEAGWAVTAVDVRASPPGLPGPARFLTCRADAPALLADVRDGRYAAVLHQAAITSTLESDWALLREVNVRQPLAIARACEAGGAAFIYASSHSVYGGIGRRVPVAEGAEHDRAVCTGPLNLYARSKLELDLAMTARGARPPWAGLRYTNVFGPGEQHKGPMASIISQMLRAAARGGRITLFEDTLKACRDYIPVETVAGVVLRLLDHPAPSGVYNLGSGSPVSFAALLEWCAQFTGRPSRVALVPNPIPGRYQYWTCADLTKITQGVPSFTAPAPGDIRMAAWRLFRRFRAGGDVARRMARGSTGEH